MKKNWWVIPLAVITPILIAALSRVPVFQYSPGSFNSWIGYWGSYLGAIIGASVVYFVSKMQIEEQNKMQLKVIEKENKITLNREMEQYYFRLEVEKLEELFRETENLNKIKTNIYNDFVKYLVNTKALSDGSILTEEQIERFPIEIREIRIDLYKWMNDGYSSIFILKRLGLYFENCQPVIMEIEELFQFYIDDIKDAYKDSASYKVYLKREGAPNSEILSNNMKELNKQINYLSVNVLQPNLQDKINKMRNSRAS